MYLIIITFPFKRNDPITILVLTLHLVLRYGCKVIACFTKCWGLILLIRYNVDKLDTSLWLLEPLPSDWAVVGSRQNDDNIILIEHSTVTGLFLVYSRILMLNLVNSFIHQEHNKGYCLQYPQLKALQELTLKCFKTSSK